MKQIGLHPKPPWPFIETKQENLLYIMYRCNMYKGAVEDKKKIQQNETELRYNVQG